MADPGNPVPGPPPVAELEIGPRHLADLRSVDPGAVRLIDCREEDEHLFCRLDGSELAPLSRFGEEHARRFPPGCSGEIPIVIYCHHGLRSAQAALFLRRLGHPRVWSLAGGIDRWSREIDPETPRY
ncbi:MAG: rhodanese [Verrucomicrobiae bacterium]|nr:rhodanese [Verrucomicrobiae bacterium]MCP5550155.1 rhodanese [Akkermansiaceae bacterium]